ncbi:Glycosyltransferase 2-like [Teratosphaeria destructans]|uniref:Glycosyltransferase 2-like n=1 Tax=Teratosphaeria destructans TaxID=418781 RepID=A0A9W7T2N4_9PEZI|nr:Glycosyltransferase 2-like [Teratosphaeria destructans]
MGLKNLFKSAAKKDVPGEHGPAETVQPAPIDEKAPSAPWTHSGLPSAHASITPSIRSSSRPTSLLQEIRHEVMANHLFQQQCSLLWISDSSNRTEGVLVRKSKASFLACPPGLVESVFARNVMTLNLPCAMTVNSRVVKTYLAWHPDITDVPLKNGLRVQILPTMADLHLARKAQNAAFIFSEGLLVIWDDEATNLIPRGQAIESDLMDLVWSTGETFEVKAELDKYDEKKPPRATAEEVDEESGEFLPEKRPTHLLNTILVSITLCIITAMLGAGWRELAIEVSGDGNYTRIAFVALAPVQIFITLFFAQVVVGCLSQMFGPIEQMKMNSRFYSALLPPRLTGTLPHVTIQMPVYKEGLAGVIAPTIRSVKQAISTYELQGGSANIFVNDDGMQIIDEEQRRARIDFYADNSIGWTARPKHGSEGFQRRGKFKKASNMNFGLMVSNNVEEKLAQVVRHDRWTQSDEATEYERCLSEVLGEHDCAWADGNVRIGDYILIIDSDTRVPADCLLDACSETEQSPEVGIMQFSSGVMQVGITFFTNLIYTAIRYTVSNGDVAPFVGHNAILRWSAIQQIGYFDEDGYEKFWSESHVSEDFEMSLKLQCQGYIIRLAAWAGEGFKEGVSLTVYDELARWEKYAYGCNELLFYPLRKWLWKGPFTPLFRTFLLSNIRFTSKITIISYIGTYYAIGAAWILTLANYFAIGWFNGYLDRYYIDSWKVWFSIVIVFNGLGNVALAIMRYRIGSHTFFGSLLENLKWTLMLAVFLGGLSLHVSQALLAHMFEVNMTWGATSKEAEQTNFFIEVPRVLKKFKFSIGFSLFVVVVMVILATAQFVPWEWRITDFIAILPMSTICVSHFLLPIVLNPGMMQFTF